MKTYLLLLLVTVGFGLTSFTGKHHPKTFVTVSGIADNNTSVAVTVTYLAFTGAVLTPAPSGGSDSDPVTYDTIDGIVAKIDFGSLITTCYAHLYVDGVFVATATCTHAHPSALLDVFTNPISTVRVICNTTP